MVQNIIKSDTKTPLLNVAHTQKFVKEMDVLLKNFDFNGMITLSKNYPFYDIDQKELNDFIERAETENLNWYKNPLELKIIAIESFESKCIACFFGKTIKAYSALYKQMKDDKLPGQLIYSRSLSIYFDIKDNELYDFGWCNSFLDKKEMNLINNKDE